MNSWQLLLIAAVVVGFAADTTLSVLNRRAQNSDEARSYDDAELERALEYKATNFSFSLVSESLSTLLTVIALAFGWIGAWDNFVVERFASPVWQALAFFAGLGLVMTVIGLPFDVYRTFSIEKRFGFNKTTPSVFILDQVKGLLIGALLGGAVIAALVWIYSALGGWFWLVAWLTLTAISFVMLAWGTSVFTPLFNKLSPLPDGELRSALVDYCHSQGYEVSRLFVMDGSKRSTKANAYFAGLGGSKTIVLYDTLIEKLSTEEVVAVLAHEVGHFRLRHILTRFLAGTGQTLVMTSVLGWALSQGALSASLGGLHLDFQLGLVAFLLFLSPTSTLIGWGVNSLSRKHEFEADQFSIRTYPGPHLASGLTKISTDALTDPSPHPAYVAVNYSHPPLKERVAALA